MTANKRAIKSNLKKVERHRISASEYDEAPEIADEALKGGKVVKRGRRPRGGQRKETVTLWLSRETIAAYRATGVGWQSRINADLLKSAEKLEAAVRPKRKSKRTKPQ